MIAAPRHLALRPALVIALSALLLAAFPSCAETTSHPKPAPPHLLTFNELDELGNAYADSYVTRLGSAIDLVLQDNPNVNMCFEANRFRLTSAVNMYDLATTSDPLADLLDMRVTVGLQKLIWVDGGRAQKIFGDRAVDLIQAMIKNDQEINRLCAMALKPQQLDELNASIIQWNQDNPEVRTIRFLRFSDIASARGKVLVTAVLSGDGLMAPISNATVEIDRTRRLAERGFYLAKRFPLIMSWQTDDAIYRVLSKDATKQALDSFKSISLSVEKLTAEIQKLPDFIDQQRRNIGADLDKRQLALDATVGRVHDTIDSSDKLVKTIGGLSTSAQQLVAQVNELSLNLTETFAEFDRMASRFDKPPATQPVVPVVPSKPFDIQDYTTAAEGITKAVHESRQLVSSSDLLLNSKAWNDRLAQINQAAAERVNQATESTRNMGLFLAGVVAALILFAFFCMLLYKRIALWMEARYRPNPSPKSPPQ